MTSIQVSQPYITRAEFEAHVKHLSSATHVTVDTEGTLTHPHSQTWGLSTSVGGVGDYFAFNHILGENLPQSWLPELTGVLQDKTLIMHHAKHDLRALRNLGLNFTGKFYCTMLMAHMNNENYASKELNWLSKHFGGRPKRDDELMAQIIRAFGWEYIPVDIIREYGSNDAFITEELFDNLYPDFVSQGFDGPIWDIEQQYIRLLADMENTGVVINEELCELELRRGLQIMREIQKYLGFNPASPVELGKFLLDELSLPVVKHTKNNKPSFDKEAMEAYDELLQQMNDNRARQVLIYRGWQKTTSSNYRRYLEKRSLVDGRLRPNFKQQGTKTGRLSCEDPNLQQIPRESPNDWNGKLKKAFVCDPEFTSWEFDYSQLEFRLAAAYAKQQNLIEIFADPSRDVFNEMAKELGMQRGPTKTLNYTVQYGGGAARVSTVFNVSQLAAKAIISRYYARYPGLKSFSNLAKRRADENGFIQYWTGRRRHFMFSSEHHKAGNSAIQGGAFEIVKRQSLAVKEAGLINEECQFNLTVHDSLRFDILKGKEHIYVPEIKNVLESVNPNFGVKFRVDAHKWGTEEQWVA